MRLINVLYFYFILCILFYLFIFFGGGIIWLTKSNISDTSSSFFLTAKAVQLFIVLSAETHSLAALTHTVTANGRSNHTFYRKPNMQMCLLQFMQTYFNVRNLRKDGGQNDPAKNRMTHSMNIRPLFWVKSPPTSEDQERKQVELL